jgi:hypothetical protein
MRHTLHAPAALLIASVLASSCVPMQVYQSPKSGPVASLSQSGSGWIYVNETDDCLKWTSPDASKDEFFSVPAGRTLVVERGMDTRGLAASVYCVPPAVAFTPAEGAKYTATLDYNFAARTCRAVVQRVLDNGSAVTVADARPVRNTTTVCREMGQCPSGWCKK